ncbi:hicA protein [Beggiatoa sp. PS]|nr:hicA protein [Beggiatoa sp. PS]
MNSKHRKTLESIFSHPIPENLEWRKIETLFVALGAEVIEGNGSRVSFILNNEKADFHRPHPGKEAKRYQVRNAKDFLIKAGVKP